MEEVRKNREGYRTQCFTIISVLSYSYFPHMVTEALPCGKINTKRKRRNPKISIQLEKKIENNFLNSIYVLLKSLFSIN